MANTSFTGPVRSENGFESTSKNQTTGVISTHADLNGQTAAASGADATKLAGALLLNSIATIGCVMKTYQATVTVANGATTGTEAAIGFPANFIPMFCVIRNNNATTTGGIIADVGTQGSAQAYVDGASVASTSAGTTQIFACNGVNGIGSGGSGTTAGIPLTPDEIMVTMADPGLSGASVTVTFVGFSFTETLNLSI